MEPTMFTIERAVLTKKSEVTSVACGAVSTTLRRAFSAAFSAALAASIKRFADACAAALDVSAAFGATSRCTFFVATLNASRAFGAASRCNLVTALLALRVKSLSGLVKICMSRHVW